MLRVSPSLTTSPEIKNESRSATPAVGSAAEPDQLAVANLTLLTRQSLSLL